VRVSNCSVNSPWDDGICLKSSYGLGFVEDLKLSNISILHQGGGTKDDAALQPPEIENAYPEPSRLGAMPAHGFYLRHVKGLLIRDVEVKVPQGGLPAGFRLRGRARRAASPRQGGARGRSADDRAQERVGFQHPRELPGG